MEKFAIGTKLVSGMGAAAVLQELGARRLMVVTDPYFYENGVARKVADGAKAEQVSFFHEISPDPTVALAARGTAAMQRFAPDTVVALGGGSAMDCAKAMLYFSGSEAKLVAIPTTSGSGSEVTDFAVLTHEGVKHPLVDGRLRPYMAVLDGELLEQLPPKLIADSGFDALTHAVESYAASGAGHFSETLAAQAFCTVQALLPASFGGDRSVRLRIHEAAAMAGIAFCSSGLGLCHAMAHSLGGMFHIPHGRLCAILLPAVVEYNSYRAAEKYARLAQAAGLGGSAKSVAVRALKNSLVRLRRELEMPATLSEAGIRPHQVWSRQEEIVKAAVADPCCATNPVAVEPFLVRKILEEVTGRG